MTRWPAHHLRFFAAVAVAVACFFVPTRARADAESDAKDLFARGRELRGQGNFGEAAVAFRKAFAVFPSGLGSLRNLAECEEELHHYASARRDWLELKRALIGTTDAKYLTWDADAQAAAARLAPHIAKLTVDVVTLRGGRAAPRPELGDVSVRVNDEVLPLALLGTELERDPGSFAVRADEAGGGGTATADVSIGQGESQRVTLRLELRHAAAPSPLARPTSAGADDPNASRRLAGYVTLGVGVASLVGAGVALAVRGSASSDLDSSCPRHVGCDPSLQSTVDRGHLATALTNVFGAIGILATGAGVALILTSPAHAGAPPKTGLTLRPMAGSVRGLSAEWSLP
jgi:hypothetical protein